MALTAPPRAPGPSVWDGLSLVSSPRSAPVAVGGALDPPTLIGAYRAGAFPWPSDDGAAGGPEDAGGNVVGLAVAGDGEGGPGRRRSARRRGRSGRPGLPWWSPDPRAVIPAGRLRVNRSLRKRLRSCGWTSTVDECFLDVMRGCRREETWITPELIEAYAELHALGWAHSVEIWEGAELVGGVYGVAVGRVFAGESMFHTRTDASKVALADFDDRFTAAGGVLLDVQLATEHLTSLGAVEIPRADFLAVLEHVRDADVRLERERRPVARLAPRPD